jgi:hypothetical protein
MTMVLERTVLILLTRPEFSNSCHGHYRSGGRIELVKQRLELVQTRLVLVLC